MFLLNYTEFYSLYCHWKVALLSSLIWDLEGIDILCQGTFKMDLCTCLSIWVSLLAYACTSMYPQTHEFST